MNVNDVEIFKSQRPQTDPGAERINILQEVAETSASTIAPTLAPGNGNVVTIDPDGILESKKQKVETLWHDITTKRLSGAYLSGVLIAVVTEGKQKYAVLSSEFDVNVFIRIEDMGLEIQMADEKVTTENLEKALNMMLSCECDYIITNIDRTKNRIYGNRNLAMKQRCEQMYFNIRPEKRIKINSRVEGRVIMAFKHSICVEVHGVICRVQLQELTRKNVVSAKELYPVGSREVFIVMDLRGTSYEKMHIKLSKLPLMEEDVYNELKALTVNDKYLATVTSVRNGMYNLRLDFGANVVAHKTLGKYLPSEGDKVTVLVNFIDLEHHVARGLITQIVKTN